MKATTKSVWVILGLLTALTAEAVPNALAEMVQSPAWIERAGKRLPLAAGMELINRDKLLTGEGARVVVRFADGSAFKMGDNSLVAVNAMQQRKNGTFAGGLDLKSGDLRLVSHEYEEAPVNRAINVRFGDVTAAVRGEADLTGTADDVRDAVALRDGRAVLNHPLAAAPTTMDVPLLVYEAAKGQAPEPLKSIDRFAGVQWQAGAGGAPLFRACCATFEVANETMHVAGDHTIFVSRVEKFSESIELAPLLFHAGQYARIA